MITHSKPYITIEDLEAVKNVLDRGIIAKGSANSEFELNISKYIGTKFTITTSSGTAALVLALKALNIKKMMK